MAACSFPDAIPVSEEARHLLLRMLEPDPDRRASVAEVRVHPWCAQDLPPGVAHMNDACLQLRGQTAGTQSQAQIQQIVEQAMGPGWDLDNIRDEDLQEEVGGPGCLGDMGEGCGRAGGHAACWAL